MIEPAQFTRERILDDAFIAQVFSQLPADARLRTPEELEASIAGILSPHDPDADVHIFGYGSLMWNPAVDHAGARPATVHGWHRSFCLRSIPRYAKGLPLDEMARMINTGEGSLGSCREYFDATLRKLGTLGIRDIGMERLRAAAGSD